MDKFKFKAYVPTLDIYVELEELKLRQYIDIVKYIANDDTDLIIQAFDSIIKCNISTEIYNKLTRVDKFFILCTLRAVCIGPVVSLVFEDEETNKQYTSKIELIKTLQSIDAKQFSFIQQIPITDDISINISLPESIGASDNDLLIDCVKTFTIAGVEHNLANISLIEKQQLIDTLPSTVVGNLTQHITKTCDTFAGVNLFRRLNPHSTPPTIDEYAVNFYDNSMLDFLIVSYRENLKNIYEMVYVLSKTLNFSGDTIYDSTYSELTIYLDLYQQELEAQEKADKAAARQNSGPGSVGNPIQPFG